MEWGSLVPIVAGLLLGVILVLAWSSIRRSMLARGGSIFDCELRLADASDADWELGLARCSGEHLEWFPRRGVGFRPAHTLSRAASGIRAQTRTTDPQGLNGQRVVRLEGQNGSKQVWELALDTDSLTALLAWVEAAPPSAGRFRS